MNVYLDAGCLNRPFDDQSQDRIRLETEAVMLVLAHVQDGTHQLVGSEALDLEIANIPDANRRERVEELLELAGQFVKAGKWEGDRANELAGLGFSAYDALHLACAESANADAFLTIDDRLLRRAARHQKAIGIRVANPIQWLLEVAP